MVDVEPGDIDSRCWPSAKKQRHIYAYAMRDFIRYVTREWEHLDQVLPAQVAEISGNTAMYGHHRRLPNLPQFCSWRSTVQWPTPLKSAQLRKALLTNT